MMVLLVLNFDKRLFFLSFMVYAYDKFAQKTLQRTLKPPSVSAELSNYDY